MTVVNAVFVWLLRFLLVSLAREDLWKGVKGILWANDDRAAFGVFRCHGTIAPVRHSTCESIGTHTYPDHWNFPHLSVISCYGEFTKEMQCIRRVESGQHSRQMHELLAHTAPVLTRCLISTPPLTLPTMANDSSCSYLAPTKHLINKFIIGPMLISIKPTSTPNGCWDPI